MSTTWLVEDERTHTSDATSPIPITPDDLATTIWVSPKRVAEMFDLSEATIYRWLKTRPDFPRPVKLSPGCTRFRLQDLIHFVASMEAGK